MKLPITQIERHALASLEESARKSMRSKFVLRTLAGLQDKGIIEFDPFAGTAVLTDLGKEALLP